jgi:glycerol-3-phosphate dehydrogenase
MNSALSSQVFDLLVIGGGIHGAAICWEATLRGLRVALVEKNDFSSGASSGNYRIIHGGLRYLQHFDLPRLFESVREQQVFRQIAPDALKPLPFIIPCYGFGMRGRELLRLGLSFYDLLTFFRNQGVRAGLELPAHRVVEKDELLNIAPHLDSAGLRGGILYYDVQMEDPDRLGLAFVLSAKERGAVVSNYTRAESVLLSGNRIESVKCLDSLTGESCDVQARFVVNASGPWRSSVAAKLLGRPAPIQSVFSKGLQVTLPGLTGSYALVLESKYRDKNAFVSKGNRSYFIQPWRGYTIAGTADILHTADPDSYTLTDTEVHLFLEELSELYPDPRISRENVVDTFGGLRPVSPKVIRMFNSGKLSSYGSIEVAHRDTVISQADEGVENMISVEGIKYTTTRKLAERVINQVVRAGGFKAGPSKSASTPLNYRKAPQAPSRENLREILKTELVRTRDDLLRRRLGVGALGALPPEVLTMVDEVIGEKQTLVF